MKPLSSIVGITGAVILASTLALAVTQAPLGSPLFLVLAATASIAYVAVLARVWRETTVVPTVLYTAFALAVAFRIPLVIPPVDASSDMVRYQWDGRIQRLGYNPYLVLPADPRMAATHTDETRRMPSGRARTPYPPGAELFFRLVVSIHDSTHAMKVALVLCDLLTMIVVWRWLALTGRNQWLTLAYAWNPLVLLEVAHSGHIDALGALWIAACVYWLAQRRTSLASIAFVMAVATKLLPIVLLPLLIGRVSRRDLLAGGVLLALLILPFARNNPQPLTAVLSVVAHVRFNGPIFRELSALASPQIAAAVAIGLGMAVAAWARWRWDASEPAAWGAPMAVSLACAPVVYPWYLLYLTPFLCSTATVPLIVWTLAVIPTYVVWQMASQGGRWVVPSLLVAAEYGAVLLSLGLTVWRLTRAPRASRPRG